MRIATASTNHRWLLLALVSALAACARGTDGGDGGDAASDIAQAEGGNACTSSAMCSAPTPICDTAMGKCVGCTVSPASCPAGQVCDPVLRRCSMGCARDMDCRMGGGGGADAGLLPDGGVPNIGTQYCLTNDSRCVQCLTNEHCPVGAICNRNVCTPGCSATRACPAGLTCCGSTCVNPNNNAQNCGLCGRTCSGANSTCCAGMCTSLVTDANNCGMCGRMCSVMNGMASCAASMCSVMGCAPGYQDVDRNPANGCECQVDTLGGACNTATDIGTVARGSTKHVRGIISAAATVQYVRVQFANPGNPRIRFMDNPGGGFRIDLLPGCTGTNPAPLACPGRAAGAVGITEFAYVDNPPMAGQMPGQDDPRMNPWPSTVIIKISTTTPQTACMPYDLLLEN